MGSTETARIERFRRAGLVFPTSDTGPLDGPPVLLLHGWPQDGRSWDAVTPGLNAAGYRTYAPTLRGATASANPASRRAYRSAELLADVEAMVGAIGRPVHLVGHDWGAALAWTVAARRPDLVRTLAAISVPHPAAFREALKGGRQLRKSWYMGFFQLPVLPELALGPRAARLRLLGSSGQDADSARRDAGRLGTYALRRGGFNWYRGALLGSPRDVGGATSVPVLQVWSDRDVAIARETVAGAQRYAHGPYRLLVFEGVSHWIPDAVPTELAAALAEHFAQS